MNGTRNTRALIAIALAAVVSALIWRWDVVRDANTELDAARARHERVVDDAEEVRTLRRRERVIEIEPQDTAAITERAQRLIREHLSAEVRIVRVQLDAPIPIDTTPYEKLRATLVLGGITPAQCALLLHHWSDADRSWTPTSLVLSRQRARRVSRANEDRYDATLQLESLVVAQKEKQQP